MGNEYDAIVVGAGYGGAAIAALLTKEGQRVLLLDKNPRAGGKSVTMTKAGHSYEMWPIVGIPARQSRFLELQQALGIEALSPELIPSTNAGALLYKKSDSSWAYFAGAGDDPTAMERLQRDFGVGPDELAGFATMAAEMLAMQDDEIDALDETCMWDWMAKFGLPHALQSYLGVILNLFFLVPVDRCPAHEGIRGLRDFLFSGGGGGRYHRGGFGRVAEDCAAYVEANGGTFMPRSRVDHIIIEDGRAVGVATLDGDFRAPVVISNAGIQPTVLSLVGPGHLPEEYVERVRLLEPSWGIVGVRYFLDTPVFETPALIAYSDESWWDTARYEAAEAGDWPEIPALYVVVPAQYDPSLAPDETHQVAMIGTMSTADPVSPMNEAAVRQVEAAAAQAWPGITDHIVRREVFTAHSVSAQSRDSVVPGQGGECIGLGQFIGQCGRSKPNPRTPLPGLYLVGCDAGGIGMGTHQAVDSAFNVAAMVLEDTRG